MTITVRLFAQARDLAGRDQIEVRLPQESTVAALREQLGKEYPQLSSLVKRSSIAVNNEFAEDSMRVSAGAEVALLPPVSGGGV